MSRGCVKIDNRSLLASSESIVNSDPSDAQEMHWNDGVVEIE